MLWKRHHSIYGSSSSQKPEPHQNQDNQKRRSALIPLLSSPTASTPHQSIQQPQKFIGRKPSKQKINKNLIPGTFFMHRGNNHQIVKSILQGFGYCQNLNKELCCLIWYQGKDVPKKDFQKKDYSPKATNYLPNHSQITNKQKLFQNISKYDPSSVGLFVPRTYVVDFKDNVPVVQSNLTQFLVQYFKKAGVSKPPKKTSSLYISNYYAQICIPLSRIFKQIPQNKRSSSPQHNRPNPSPNSNLWIVKPAFLNRGQGIQVITTLKQLQNILSQDSQQISIRMYQPEEKNVPSSFVIQEYIMDPLLYQGYKFDMRVWMLLRVSRGGGLQVFLHRKGYVRLACHKYASDGKQEEVVSTDPDQSDKKQAMSKSIQNNSPSKPSKLKSIDANDRYIHLTNNAVQKNCKEYGNLHQGNQLLISDLTQKLSIQSLTEQYLYNNFKKIVKILIQSSKQKLQSKAAVGTFQLMGLDFMIDSKLNVWLIQANCNPCLEESSGILKELIPEMLREMFELVKIHRIMGVKEGEYESVAGKEKCWERLM